MNSRTPKPNTQFFSWFYGEHKKKTLKLTPKYQRNPIWSIGQKCFLIDSLISGCPIPQVYINVVNEGIGSDRKTYYEVVDGQQRLRAIIDFMDDDYALVSTTAKSYPVSDEYKPYIGKKYSQLPPNVQDNIWNYPLAVQELRGWSDEEIRALFRRLNYVVERLNKQELRHSQYFGEFADAVEKLADEAFWDDIRLFSRRDSQRMLDIEFVGELLILLIDGPQQQQATLDRFYADYDVVYEFKRRHMNKFRIVLRSMQTIRDFINNTRFSKKGDFYGLFGATCNLLADNMTHIDLSPAQQELQNLHDALRQDPVQLTGTEARYYSTVIEGPNKLVKRQERIDILYNILSNTIRKPS
jgi:hypothetical protein